MRRMSKRVMGPTIAAVLVLVGGTWADIGATGGDTTVPDGSTGATNADGETRTLGVSVLNRRQEIFINQLEVAEEWAAENGYELLIGDPDNDPLVQSDLLQGWLDSDQVDGIYVGPIDVAALEPVLEQADEEGIPVALSGFDEPQNDSRSCSSPTGSSSVETLVKHSLTASTSASTATLTSSFSTDPTFPVTS